MDDDIGKALDAVVDSLNPFLEGEHHDVLDVQEACIAVEALEAVLGADSLSTRRLRKALEKRGLNKPTT